MNLVLFGAGASYGSFHIHPVAPPLGGQLFDRLCEKYPKVWGELSPELTDAFRSNFEAGMVRVMEGTDHLVSPLMRTLGLYFLEFRADNSHQDLYSILLQRLRGAGSLSTTLFSTLNYECIVETAASQLGLRVDHGEIPSHIHPFVLWKLHGSCNLIPDPKSIHMGAAVSFRWGMNVNVQLITVRDLGQVMSWIRGDNALFPAMCMFAPGKPSMFDPERFKAFWIRWAAQVQQAERVVVIGVRPVPDDAHIWGPLAQTSAEVSYVGSEEEWTTWLLDRRKHARSSFLGHDFAGAMDAVMEKLSS